MSRFGYTVRCRCRKWGHHHLPLLRCGALVSIWGPFRERERSQHTCDTCENWSHDERNR